MYVDKSELFFLPQQVISLYLSTRSWY